MMRVQMALLALLAAAALAAAGDVTKLDDPPKRVWKSIECPAVLTTLTTGGDKPAKWYMLRDHPAASLLPAPDGKTAAFAATAAGEYEAVVVAGDDVTWLKLVRPVPQPMPPTPDPTPPKPPVPVPPTPPPAPVDPLVKVLQAGYDADTRAPAAKETDRLDLVELYKQAGTLALDANVTTTGQLVGKVKDAAKALGIVGLADVRKAIGAELAAVFPEDVPLTADSRKKAVDLFARIKAALEGVK